MDLDAPLDDLLKNRSQLRLLRALNAMPEGSSASARELERRAGVSHPSALAGLQELVVVGVVSVHRTPGVDLYRLNTEHAAAQALRALLSWERSFRDETFEILRELVRGEAGWVSDAIVFGSVLAVQEHPRDLDLALVVRKQDLDRTEVAAEQIRGRMLERTGVQLDVVVGAASEKRSGSRLWKHIWEDGLPLFEEAS